MRPAATAMLALALLAGCSALNRGSLEEGDRLYALGRYAEALAEYRAAAGEHPGPELEERIRLARFQVLAEAAREAIHLEQPEQALAWLDRAEEVLPEHPLTGELRRRAAEQLSEMITREAFEHLSEDEPAAAVVLFGEALRWNPGNARAQSGLAEARVEAEQRFAKGEDLFLQGVEALREARDGRALTYLAHARDYWGEDSRAGELEREVADLVASDLTEQAERSLRAGNLGAAWVALRQAVELDPGDEDLLARLERLDRELRTRELLMRAELRIRSGSLEEAQALLDQIVDLGVEGHEEELARLDRRLELARNEDRYRRARAYELDGQVQRAADLYQEVLVSVGDEGFEDTAERYRRLQDRLAQARRHYAAALEAQEDGDPEGYRRHLEACVRLARDFADASERLRNLGSARETPPEESSAADGRS